MVPKDKISSEQLAMIQKYRVVMAAAAITSVGKIEDVAAMLKLMGDPTKLRILAALTPGELCAGELAETVNMSKSAVSHQMNCLKDHYLVKCRREGKNIFYSLYDNHVLDLFRSAKNHTARLDPGSTVGGEAE